MVEYDRAWIADADQRFGRRMRAVREERNISQNGVSVALQVHGLGWHQTTVAKVEAGTRPVRLVEALAVADALGVALDDLLDDPESDTARRRRAVSLIARRAELGTVEGLLQGVVRNRMRHLDDRLEGVADRVVEVGEGVDDGEHPAAP